jgi:hypothetical protein
MRRHEIGRLDMRKEGRKMVFCAAGDLKKKLGFM